jgi:hypothetical protein
MAADVSALEAKGGNYVAVGHAPNLGAAPIHFLWQVRHNTENSLLNSLIAGNWIVAMGRRNNRLEALANEFGLVRIHPVVLDVRDRTAVEAAIGG